MALPLVHVDRHRAVDPRRTLSPGSITTLGGSLDVVGRAVAISFVGILAVAGPGIASLAIIGILAIASALVSWSD